jgi:tetratricopeptide (TPR) repeat protein
MHTETMDRQAFELVAKAMQRLDDYNRDRQLSFLQDAESVLAQAITRDAQYLDASFYAGVVKDLIGKSADAVHFFDRILNNLPKESEDRRDVMQYSRGVAWYHQYSHSKLEQAEKDFLGIIDRSKDRDLRLLARAGLAQTYAMWMIPRTSAKEKLRRGEGADELKFIETKRGECLKQIDLVNERQSESGFAYLKQPTALLAGPIQGTILNARGMCTMYWTDYNVKDAVEKRKLIVEAIGYLEEANKYLPGDWANTCDMASAHLRMGVVLRQLGTDFEPEFQKALALLRNVIDDLRPNYGFAFYEMGRIYRVWKHIDEAKASFKKSLDIPDEYRDAGVSTVTAELNRAEEGDFSFP